MTLSPEEEVESTVAEETTSIEDVEKTQLDQDDMPAETTIAGFWRRLFAFIIDVIILAVPLNILGAVFSDIAFAMGPWGRPIGYAVELVYLTYFNSHYGHGQTLGKRVLKLAVVDRAGDYLSVGRSAVRALVLCTVFLVNGWAIPVFTHNMVLMAIISILLFGVGLALVYGIVFNRRTRQGLHDIIAKSYVVNVPILRETSLSTIPKFHLRMMYALFGLSLVLMVAGIVLRDSIPTFGILDESEWTEMTALQQALMENNAYFTASVQRNNMRVMGQPGVTRSLAVSVWIKGSCRTRAEYCDALVDEIARTVFENYDGIEELDMLQITTFNRYDLGLATGSWSHLYRFPVDEWRKQIEG